MSSHNASLKGNADALPAQAVGAGPTEAGVVAVATRPALERMVSRVPSPAPPASAPLMGGKQATEMVLDLADGTSYTGISFGAEGKSISGECVFQTGEHWEPKCLLLSSPHLISLLQEWSATSSRSPTPHTKDRFSS